MLLLNGRVRVMQGLVQGSGGNVYQTCARREASGMGLNHQFVITVA